MKEIKKEKLFWNKHFHFPDQLEKIPNSIRHINLRCSEVTDTDIFYLVTRIQTIEILDLDETQITDEGVKYLHKLSGLKELRLKGNISISNKCIPDLNELFTLELLHLAATSVTLDGILELTKLQNLKTLLFSNDDPINLPEKMIFLKQLYPGCDFIINSQRYYF